MPFHECCRVAGSTMDTLTPTWHVPRLCGLGVGDTNRRADDSDVQDSVIPSGVDVIGHRRSLAFVCLVLGAVAMGASPIFVRLADVGPYASAFWRTFLALPLLFLWAMAEHVVERRRLANLEAAASRRRTNGRRDARPPLDRLVLLTGLLFAGDLFFWHLAILGTTVANATFLATTAPIWVALGAWLIAAERIGVHTLLGLALCLVGGVALLGQSYGFAPERLPGDLAGVVTAVFFGSYVLAVRAARRRHGAGALILSSTGVTAACLFVIALVLEPRLLPQSATGWAALVALAVVSHVGGQGLVALALGALPATFSSLVIFLEAIAAAAFGWLIFGEALGPLQAAGGVLILVGIWLAHPRARA
jgi:drug/metabolite transporter (DMT)-like permease